MGNGYPINMIRVSGISTYQNKKILSLPHNHHTNSFEMNLKEFRLIIKPKIRLKRYSGSEKQNGAHEKVRIIGNKLL